MPDLSKPTARLMVGELDRLIDARSTDTTTHGRQVTAELRDFRSALLDHLAGVDDTGREAADA